MSIRIPSMHELRDPHWGREVYIGDTREFTYGGERFRATVEVDDWQEAPWTRSDFEVTLDPQRGRYSEVAHNKPAGTLVLRTDRGDGVWTVNVPEAVRAARREWGCKTRKDAADAVARSIAVSLAWLNDEWCWVRVKVESLRTEECEYLSGIESYTDYALSDEVCHDKAYEIQCARKKAWRAALVAARERKARADAEYQSWMHFLKGLEA